jgi:hypothetical protein
MKFRDPRFGIVVYLAPTWVHTLAMGSVQYLLNDCTHKYVGWYKIT